MSQKTVETVTVIIHPDGRVELQVCGVKGDKCLEVTSTVEEALGGNVHRTVTAEMYEQEEPKIEPGEGQVIGH